MEVYPEFLLLWQFHGQLNHPTKNIYIITCTSTCRIATLVSITQLYCMLDVYSVLSKQEYNRIDVQNSYIFAMNMQCTLYTCLVLQIVGMTAGCKNCWAA